MSIPSRVSLALRNGVVGGMNTLYAAPYRNASLAVAATHEQEASNADLLDTLLGYYFSNGLYQTLNLVGAGAENSATYQKVKSIRNPVSAFVSFYQFKLFPNPLIPVLAEDNKRKAVLSRIDEIWRRSAWLRAQPRAAFHFSLMGELFVRAGQRESDNAPILQLIDPRHVTELDLDERGYIQWIRIEYPYAKRDPQTGKETERYYVEVWQKGEGGARRRVWDLERKLMLADILPRDPMIDHSTAERTLAIDFVPIAYAPFVSVDNGRGMSPVLSALEDIDEANRMATRLHAMLFRGGRTTWVASANASDANGRPMPAPMLQEAMTSTSNIELDDGDSIMGLPGMATLQSLVPSLPYGDALAILQAHMDWIAENKLFELGYYKTTTGTEESGRARRYRLEAALNRARMGRATTLDTLGRADQMCLTLGQALKVKGYSAEEIGTFDNGDFNHDFQPQDLLELSVEEKANTSEALVRTGGEINAAFRTAGFTNNEADALAELGIPPEQ